MAIFESLVNALRVLAVGDRVKVTLDRKPGSSQILRKGKSPEGSFRKLFVTVGTRRHSG